MRKMLMLVTVSLTLSCVSSSNAKAGGLLQRLRGNVQRSSAPSPQYAVPARRSYPARNARQDRNRLPAGRSYYQGRYYGNFNNRFYGPQYGYF